MDPKPLLLNSKFKIAKFYTQQSQIQVHATQPSRDLGETETGISPIDFSSRLAIASQLQMLQLAVPLTLLLTLRSLAVCPLSLCPCVACW